MTSNTVPVIYINEINNPDTLAELDTTCRKWTQSDTTGHNRTQPYTIGHNLTQLDAT